MVSVAVASAPASYNPLTPEGDTPTTQEVMSALWPSAFVVGADFVPNVNFTFLSSAELTSVAPQTVVYKINPKAVWSDGVPISADDFVYNWHAQSGDPTYSDVGGKPFEAVTTLGYSDISSVTGSDGGKTVTVVFKQPFSDWESLFDPLVPAHIAEKVGWNDGFTAFSPSVEVSGGPFEIRSAGASSVDLVPNPQWWGSPPNVAGIDLVVMPDISSAVSALSGGQIQVVEGPAELDELQSVSYLDHVTAEVVPSFDFEQIDFNLRNPILASVAVRQAIADDTDRNALIAAGPGQLIEFEGFQLPREDDNHVFVPAGPYYPAGTTYDETPSSSAAAKLLEGAGWVTGTDGYWHQGSPSGPVLALRYTTDESDPIKQAVAQTFQAQMKAAGIQVNLVNDDPTQLAADIGAGNFDLAEVTVTASPYPSEFLSMYGSQSEVPAGSAVAPTSTVAPQSATGWPLDHAPLENLLGYVDPAVNQLFVKAIANPDPYDAAGDYNQLDSDLWADMPSLPLYEDSVLVAYSDTVSGIAAGGESSGPSAVSLLWNADQWSLKSPTTTTAVAGRRRVPRTGVTTG